MKYITFVLVVLVILISSIVLIFNREPSSTPVSSPNVDIVKYIESDAQAVFTEYGELISEEERRAIRIRVSRNQRKLEILQGYNEKVIKEHTLSNTQAAYDEFINALKKAGYDKHKKSKYTDDKGVCPEGIKTTYKLVDGGEELLSLWSTSCAKSDGNLNGSIELIKNLFNQQIPDFEALTEGVELSN